MIKRLTKRQIVDETVEYYKADPTRVAKGNPPSVYFVCYYITDDGRKCAVGRCMINPKPWVGGVDTQWKTIEELDKELEERYRGHSLEFWKNVQALHDFANWPSEKSIQQYVDEIDCKMSMPEIVEETLQYYLEDPSRRAVDAKGRCQYYTEDGKMCAVGRCMLYAPAHMHCTKAARSFTYEELQRLLKPDYREHSIEFWEDLQNIHDSGLWELHAGKDSLPSVIRSYARDKMHTYLG